MTIAYQGLITAGQALAGTVALLIALLFTQPSLAGGDDHRALRFLRDKGIITQQEYDQAVAEEQPEKPKEPRANGVTKDGLQFTVGGFAELDFIGDNTRSFEEVIGNRPVLRSDTLAGANGRYTTSPRNSRLILDVRAPERNGIKTQFHGSLDFLGNEPDIGTASTSELTVRTSPTARVFQLFFKVETPVIDVKIGQDWSRFGFMSEYSRGQVSVAATPANMFNRWIQASVSKRLNLTDTLSLTPVLSVERPPQRDAGLPSFVAGAQVAYHGLQAPYTSSSTGRISLKPLSVQISGVGRRLEANSGGPTNSLGGQPTLSSQTYVTGWGLSSSLFLPILPSKNGELGNTAHVVMEGVTGAGIADFFNGLSWGICNPVCGYSSTNSGFGGAAFGQTDLDAGLGAVSSRTGKFEAIRTTSMMVHSTYYLPDNGKTWIGGGYGTIYSSNASEMTCTVSASFCGGSLRTVQSIYIRDSTYYTYIFHDFTEQIRAALTTNWVRTTYADGANAENHRIQVSFFYRF
ncbi:MAG: hypothetical protein NT179_02800 [Nitrospirae bacterium]|nr:hypothetical protein [Nitrospirota bacterium]